MAFEDYFDGARMWRVLTEAHGEVVSREGVTVRFSRGHFELPVQGCFQSPLSGNRGRRGVLLQEVFAGEDVPGSLVPVGDRMLSRVRQAGSLAP